MRIHAVQFALLVTLCVLLASCASNAARNVDKTLYLCEVLRGPDARDEEVRFWFNSARAEASRKLWNRPGEKAVTAALMRTESAEDRECLVHLQQEIRAREASGW
ncbi:MAG: hypothetical protein EON58_06160 [Alphaproteobacteria bacterium]|nr:MAG: hypothetical protein EON58_06160 [Alphaproteobacteria bacterium]